MDIFPTTVNECLRHTGAGCFVRSSAVSYNRAVLWYLIEMFLDLIGGHAKSIRQFLIRLSPRRWITGINERELFATIQPLSYFIRSDSRCFHHTPPCISPNLAALFVLFVDKKHKYRKNILCFWCIFVARTQGGKL
jgi:hypothetical protein